MTRNRKIMYNPRWMRKFRDRNNGGFTLIELILAISVGTMITLAGTAVLMMCLRVHSTSSQSARRQGQVLTAVTTMENLVADNSNIGISQTGDKILNNGLPLITWKDETLVNAGGGVILEDVESFLVTMEGNSLLRVAMKVQGEDYDFFILSGSAASEPLGTGAGVGARFFLKTLSLQLGTAENENYGFIRENGVSTGVRYATWYNSAWGEEAAWCSCFVSWGLEQSRGYIAGATPKYASVNSFKAALERIGMWESAYDDGYTPQLGDLIFFDWDLDGTLDHVGAVIKVENGRVYTIEGNSDGKVQKKDYPKDSRYIAGYGKINWIG